MTETLATVASPQPLKLAILARSPAYDAHSGARFRLEEGCSYLLSIGASESAANPCPSGMPSGHHFNDTRGPRCFIQARCRECRVYPFFGGSVAHSMNRKNNGEMRLPRGPRLGASLIQGVGCLSAKLREQSGLSFKMPISKVGSTRNGWQSSGVLSDAASFSAGVFKCEGDQILCRSEIIKENH